MCSNDSFASIAQICDCEFVAISHSISETVQASAKVTIECEYEVICDPSNGVEQLLQLDVSSRLVLRVCGHMTSAIL